MYSKGIPSYIFVCISFLGGKEFCILRILIVWSCTHVIPFSNIECTPVRCWKPWKRRRCKYIHFEHQICSYSVSLLGSTKAYHASTIYLMVGICWKGLSQGHISLPSFAKCPNPFSYGVDMYLHIHIDFCGLYTHNWWALDCSHWHENTPLDGKVL